MRIIATKTLSVYAAKFRDAANELGKWSEAVQAARWANGADVVATFQDADQVVSESGQPLWVFNIRRNRYRLIVAIHFPRKTRRGVTTGRVYVREMLTHADYDRGTWKKRS